MFKLLKCLLKKTYKQKKSTQNWAVRVDKWLEEDYLETTY